MGDHDNLRAMHGAARELLDDFLLLFDRHVKWDGDRAFVPYGSLPAAPNLPVSTGFPE